MLIIDDNPSAVDEPESGEMFNPKDVHRPSLTVRITSIMALKLKETDLYKSILSDGSIFLEELNDKRLSMISDQFEEVGMCHLFDLKPVTVAFLTMLISNNYPREVKL